MRMCKDVSNDWPQVLYFKKDACRCSRVGYFVDVCINFEWLLTVTICLYLKLNKNANANTQSSITNGFIFYCLKKG